MSKVKGCTLLLPIPPHVASVRLKAGVGASGLPKEQIVKDSENSVTVSRSHSPSVTEEAPGECLYLYWAVPQRLKPGPAPEQEAGPQPSFHIGGFRDKPGREEVACITSERPGLVPGISEPLAKGSKE